MSSVEHLLESNPRDLEEQVKYTESTAHESPVEVHHHSFDKLYKTDRLDFGHCLVRS